LSMTLLLFDFSVGVDLFLGGSLVFFKSSTARFDLLFSINFVLVPHLFRVDCLPFALRSLKIIDSFDFLFSPPIYFFPSTPNGMLFFLFTKPPHLLM
jgi:hypothetical protein